MTDSWADKVAKIRMGDEPGEWLVDSIKRHGMQNPLTVVVVKDGFQLISGHARFRAFLHIYKNLTGMRVPCLVRADVEDEGDNNLATILALMGGNILNIPVNEIIV